MADRGRDVVLRVVSDESKFDLSDVAAELEDVASSSQDAARDLADTRDELKRVAAQGKDAQRQLDALNREVADNNFDTYGNDAKDAARKVDRAFDDIAKSAKKDFKQVGDDAHTGFHEVGESTAEVKDEAKANLSEVTSSFQGDMTSAVDLIQGTLGGLVAGLPGVGAAVAGAAAIAVGGIAALMGKSKEAAEENKQAVQDLFDALVEGQGRMQEAAVQGRVQDLLGDPDKFREMKTEAADAGVSLSVYARALAGSVPDQKKMNDQLVAASKGMSAAAAGSGKSTGALVKQQQAIQKVADKLGIAKKNTDDATSAWNVMSDATKAGITANVKVRTPTAKELANEHAELQHGMGKPVTTPVTVVGVTRAAQLANAQIQDYFRNHPIKPVYVGPGKKPVRDVQ